MQEENQQNQPENTQVVNRLAQLRREHNNFRRDEQQEEVKAPMGSSLVEREEIIPQPADQEEQNVTILTDFQIRQFKMLAQALDLAVTEESMRGKSAEDITMTIIGAAIESGKSQEEIEAVMGAEEDQEAPQSDHQNQDLPVVQNQDLPVIEEVKVDQNEEVRAMIPQQFDQIIGGEEDDDQIEHQEVVQIFEPVPKESIKVTQEEIDELVRKYPNGLSYNPVQYSQPSEFEQRLDIANLVQEDRQLREKANYFVCAICTNVVKGPLECSGCQTLFCGNCIDPWRQNNNHCPKKCQGNDDVDFRPVHRYVQQDLRDLKFRCVNPGCEIVHKYDQAFEHVKECSKLFQPCIQGCGLGILGEDMTYHCVKQCHFYKKSCEKCGEFSTYPNKPGQSNEIAEHDCFEVLKQKLKEERETVAALRAENEQLRNGYVGEEQKQSVLTGLKCADAHNLTVHVGAVDSYQGNPRCDLCQTEDLNEHPRFYRCAPCGFDVCEACANILADHDSEDEE